MKRLSISVLTLVAMVPAMAQAQDTLLDEIVVLSLIHISEPTRPY